MIVDIPFLLNNIRSELVFQMKSRDDRGYSHHNSHGPGGTATV
jgi:hypothetical protein